MSISAINYLKLACLLEAADVTQIDATNSLVEMQNILTDTRGADLHNVRLGDEISALRDKISEYRVQPTFVLIGAVRRLQLHIIKFHGSVNNFLSSNNIQVSPFFAALSLRAGYQIDSQNIGSSCA